MLNKLKIFVKCDLWNYKVFERHFGDDTDDRTWLFEISCIVCKAIWEPTVIIFYAWDAAVCTAIECRERSRDPECSPITRRDVQRALCIIERTLSVYWFGDGGIRRERNNRIKTMNVHGLARSPVVSFLSRDLRALPAIYRDTTPSSISSRMRILYNHNAPCSLQPSSPEPTDNNTADAATIRYTYSQRIFRFLPQISKKYGTRSLNLLFEVDPVSKSNNSCMFTFQLLLNCKNDMYYQ